MTSAISNYFTNPYYGVNQANGTKPTEVAESKESAAAAGAAALAAASPKAGDVTQEFLDYAKLSVPERIRKQFLESKGLDEKSLAAMSEEERQKIEDEFRELLEKKMKEGLADGVAAGKKTGLVANIVV
ncbi:MAG: hypothetical protein OJJ21_03625 [Ferrovibrio sp.]|uniref:hypothetical protein n=1 Tax=Ferrovibrio sp. TaxID=1917215 RepID=UPI00263698EE|nr:hypothetical protein [Ferrovibrio sp.]MCW0232668.1 hypothetical protein [Ferrovibrio sp.]